jgi:hypothetical protein
LLLPFVDILESFRAEKAFKIADKQCLAETNQLTNTIFPDKERYPVVATG